PPPVPVDMPPALAPPPAVRRLARAPARSEREQLPSASEQTWTHTHGGAPCPTPSNSPIPHLFQRSKSTPGSLRFPSVVKASAGATTGDRARRKNCIRRHTRADFRQF